MELHGKNLIAGKALASSGAKTFSGVAAATGEKLSPLFYEATPAEVDTALALAEEAFADYRRQPADKIAAFLDRIAEEILKLGDELLQRASRETGLPEARLVGERNRTIHQFKMFAELVREGSWLEASIDRAQPDRKPLPKVDLRRMLVPLGPVVAFGASNFPLAYSVGGVDTSSALAAGCPVVVKAHPAHPGASELVARAIQAAVEASGMPPGVFSMVHAASNEISIRLVQHPAAKAVGFTGSLSGGRALFDAAAKRLEPIPVFAEMGSTNPVFILPNALKQNGKTIAEGFAQSVTLGVGQFCTNPGLAFGAQSDDWRAFVQRVGELAGLVAPGIMLHQGISARFQEGTEKFQKVPGVNLAGKSSVAAAPGRAPAMVFNTDAKTFQQQPVLREEVFGPSTLLVNAGSTQELEQIARDLPGQLTATVHGTEQDLIEHAHLVAILREKCGRLIFNQFPTGVEVCPSMQHGGPYPATTDSRFTSVGTFAIKRFVRPVCFQNFPDSALPPELKNKNSRNIWRLVDGSLTKEDC
ncbi:MAG TPA: aldehyde dehydrogenase (NADP(+)) [Verrucomicrobiae bacterium]|jgi:NADP-dependent aldehyde dehydrogenase|nr:aldehyde dehydrogenase (NADP(+)) [Verrucomicrobiae bacterium]